MNNKYNPKIHNRKSIRLKGYDYSQTGLYFVTICTQNRTYLFGEIKNGKMELNEAGLMIKKWYKQLENKFPNIQNHQMIIMPNHFHCIIEIAVGADLCVCPNTIIKGEHTGSPLQMTTNEYIMNEHTGSPLHQVVQWFKTMTTNEYIRNVKLNNWERFDGKLWQRNYWEHIIRNENEYFQVSQYIIENPEKWESDKLNLDNYND